MAQLPLSKFLSNNKLLHIWVYSEYIYIKKNENNVQTNTEYWFLRIIFLEEKSADFVYLSFNT